MKIIKAGAPYAHVTSGNVKLTADQAAPRRHALRAITVDKKGAGTYAVLEPIQFKAGEEFGFSGDVSKEGICVDPAAEQARRQADEREAAAMRAAELSHERTAGAEQERARIVAAFHATVVPAIEAAKPANLAEILDAWKRIVGDVPELGK